MDNVHEHRRSKVNARNRIPQGWLDCPTNGQEIECLIPSKVPLCESYDDCVPPAKRYTFEQVIHQQNVLRRSLGLVIDLTNTIRYYTASDLKIKHIKIACKGRGAVPDNASVNKFVYEVTQFLSCQNEPTKYILVHCTHGYNRTGFMIINYLLRSQSMSVTQAIKVFFEARPPGIYKPDYIDALYKFYHERKPETFISPRTPEWKKISELDLNGEAYDKEENHHMDINMTNNDILGDEIPNQQKHTLRRFCYEMLKLNVGPRGRSLHFPGSHPVSLNRDNLKLLRHHYYSATWKADGTRYMMLINNEGCYLIDRSFDIRRVQMRFAYRHPSEVHFLQRHHCTLVDGEMVIDVVPDTMKQKRRYLIYDVMAINGLSIIERPFCERWKMLEQEVIEPRNYEQQNSYRGNYIYELELFKVERKDFWLLSNVTNLVEEFIPRLSHKSDGLIFQGWYDPYVPCTDERVLKWKYPETNSVDFLFKINVEGDHLLSLYERGKTKLMERDKVVFRDGTNPTLCSGKIIECSWNSEECVWVYMRVRTDKSAPNDFNTYKKVMRSLEDHITEDLLLGEISRIVLLPMYADFANANQKPRFISIVSWFIFGLLCYVGYHLWSKLFT